MTWTHANVSPKAEAVAASHIRCWTHASTTVASRCVSSCSTSPLRHSTFDVVFFVSKIAQEISQHPRSQRAERVQPAAGLAAAPPMEGLAAAGLGGSARGRVPIRPAWRGCLPGHSATRTAPPPAQEVLARICMSDWSLARVAESWPVRSPGHDGAAGAATRSRSICEPILKESYRREGAQWKNTKLPNQFGPT